MTFFLFSGEVLLYVINALGHLYIYGTYIIRLSMIVRAAVGECRLDSDLMDVVRYNCELFRNLPTFPCLYSVGIYAILAFLGYSFCPQYQLQGYGT